MSPFPPVAEQKCINCLYSRGGKEGGYAFCQRNPPTLSPWDHTSLNLWPGVSPNEWCGEWAPKEQPA